MKFTSVLMGFFVGLIFMVLFPALAYYLNLLGGLVFIDSKIFFFIGFLFILFGAVLFLYCTNLFVNFGKGTPAPIGPPKKFVVVGLYKHIRNPMYVSYLIILFGEFLIFGHILQLAYILLIFIFINLFLIYYEEPILMTRFGNKFLKYMGEVPRFVPRLRN